jgi:hypothetical protein
MGHCLSGSGDGGCGASRQARILPCRDFTIDALGAVRRPNSVSFAIAALGRRQAMRVRIVVSMVEAFR